MADTARPGNRAPAFRVTGTKEAGNERLSVVHRTGWLRLLTIPFLLMGLALMAGAPLIAPHLDHRQAPAPYAMFVLGLFTTAAGFALTFLVIERVIDLSAGTVRAGWRLPGLRRERRWPLSDFVGVFITRAQVFSGRGVVYTRFHVRLAGAAADVYLTEFTFPAQARAAAAEVSAFTGLPVVDASDET